MITRDMIVPPPKGTDLICRHIAETSFEDLSEENLELFKLRLFDMIGCIFGGACVEEDQFFADIFMKWGGAPEAPLFTRKGRLPLNNAVMMNCLLARANDYGSMLYHIFGDRVASHYGESLIPLGLTLADVFETSGKEFVTSNIVAEDAIGRLLYTLPKRFPTDMQLGSSICTALASRYYKLSAEQIKVALSYAATNTSDPANAYYDYCQEFKYWNAENARMGIMACEIARSGMWDGMEDPFFGNLGLITNQIKPTGELPPLYEKAFEGLGEVYFTECSFKRGPGGIPTTAASECGTLLNEKLTDIYGKVDPDAISRVRVLSSIKRKYYYDLEFPKRNQSNALFSYRFAAVCSLLHHRRKVADIQTKAIRNDPRLIELVDNATMESYDNETEAIKLIVEMKDGSSYEQECDYLLMDEMPGKELLLEKFWDQFNAFGKLPKSVGEKILECTDKIETLSDMRELTSLLVL